MNNEFEVLVYQVGKQDMAFDVEYVGMVIEKPEITPVPRSKQTIKGVTNLRGRIVPVINLGKCLGLDDGDASEQTWNVIVVNWEDIEAGFLVNSVRGVLRCSDAEVEQVSKVEKFGEKSKGIIKKDGKLIVYLSVDQILGELTAISELK